MKRTIKWKSMNGWTQLNEFELREMADMFDPPQAPAGKLLPMARALLKQQRPLCVVVRFAEEGKHDGTGRQC